MKTTAEKIAVMQACLPDFSNLECRFNREGGDVRWASYDYKYLGEPTWDWSTWDWRIKPPEPKKHEVTTYAHFLINGRGGYTVRCADETFLEGWTGLRLLAVKPITFTITEGEGIEQA